MKRPPHDQESAAPHPSWKVPLEQAGVRLDLFVRHCLPHLSLRERRRALEERAFAINGRPGRKGDRLREGDVVALQGAEHWLRQAPTPRADTGATILYEDESVLAVDKPAEMATHGFSGREKNSLANFLLAVRPALAGVGNSAWEPGLVHRLDQGTSGVVLVAKDQVAFAKLRFQFARGLVDKRYWALVWGAPKRHGAVAYPLMHDPRDRRKMKALMVAKPGAGFKIWRAVSRFRVIAHAEDFSLLEIAIETGVTHQIRVHLETLGHPLVGDPLYGKNRADPFALGRQFLHACRLGFRHPASGAEITVHSPLPEVLKKILERLRINL